MVKNGAAFHQALSQAQANGYAEANPDADIKGHDVCRKICILSALCFGRHVYPELVPTEGIDTVTLNDIGYAGRIGYKIKLLGRAIHEEDDKIAVYVAPHLVSEENLISGVEGVMNGIVVRGNAIGDVMFYGAGAGKLPTASAVVADIIDAAKHVNARKWLSWADGGPDIIYDVDLLENEWYVRTTTSLDVIKSIFGEISVISGCKEGETAFITAVMSKKKADGLFKEICVLSSFRIID
jgi:homoserine dehydrogenase